MDLTPEREHRSFPKGKTRRQVKGRKDRAEAAVKKSVRIECAARDGACRLCFHGRSWWAFHMSGDVWGALATATGAGVSEWAHMHVKRRSQTRGQAPQIRHTTQDSLMLCSFHHREYDAHRLHIRCLTRQGANGGLKFKMAKT